MNMSSSFPNIMILIAYGIISIVLLFLIEYGVFKRMIGSIRKKINKKHHDQKKKVGSPLGFETPPPIDDPSLIGDPSLIDGDVHAEKELIENMTKEQLRSQAVVMKNVSKFYGKSCAVDDLSLSVKR